MIPTAAWFALSFDNVGVYGVFPLEMTVGKE